MNQRTMSGSVAQQNTDKELWREREGDNYADSIHVTKEGGIGINCGGTVFVRTLRAWHALAKAALAPEQPGEDDTVMRKYRNWHHKHPDNDAGAAPLRGITEAQFSLDQGAAPEALSDRLETIIDNWDSRRGFYPVDMTKDAAEMVISALRRPAGVEAWAVVGPDGMIIQNTVSDFPDTAWAMLLGKGVYSSRSKFEADGYTCRRVRVWVEG